MQMKLEPGDQVRQIKEKAAWARKQEEGARQQLGAAERARKFWESLSTHLGSGHHAHVLLLLRREAGYLKYLKASGDPIFAMLEEVRVSAEKGAKEVASSFGRTFPDAVRKAGIEIDSDSRHPRYSFKKGFLKVDVDERNYTARLSPRDGEELLMGMDVDSLVTRLKSEIVRIFEREFKAEGLLKSLYTAYQAALRTESRPEGEELPLRRVTSRLAKNLNRFAADEFNVDLARLIKSGDLTIDGKRIHLNHTRNPRQGMLLHGLEEGGYVGFVSFRKEGRS